MQTANTKHLLVLEDDYEAVAELLLALRRVEDEILPDRLVITVHTDSTSVEEKVNILPADAYDVTLLDRDCGIGGSFHCLDIEKFTPERVISISSIPQWNLEARERGVARVVLKTFGDLENFATKTADEVREVLAEVDQ